MDEDLLEATVAGKEVPAVNAVAKAEGVKPRILSKQMLWDMLS